MSTGQVIVNTDGASRGNPGQASIAFVIQGLADQSIEFQQAIGVYSNNQAEYRAMKAALERLVEEDVKNQDILLNADSELMIKQIKGEYRVKDQLLKPLHLDILTSINQLEKTGNSLEFVFVRRAENKRADELANIALDTL